MLLLPCRRRRLLLLPPVCHGLGLEPICWIVPMYREPCRWPSRPDTDASIVPPSILTKMSSEMSWPTNSIQKRSNNNNKKENQCYSCSDPISLSFPNWPVRFTNANTSNKLSARPLPIFVWIISICIWCTGPWRFVM